MKQIQEMAKRMEHYTSLAHGSNRDMATNTEGDETARSQGTLFATGKVAEMNQIPYLSHLGAYIWMLEYLGESQTQ